MRETKGREENERDERGISNSSCMTTIELYIVRNYDFSLKFGFKFD